MYQQYLVVLFEKVMDLDQGFWDYLVKLNEKTDFINVVIGHVLHLLEILKLSYHQLQKTADGVKTQNAFHIKAHLPEYIVLNPKDRNAYYIPKAIEDVKQTQRGWYNNIIVQFLCPKVLKADFKEDPEWVYILRYMRSLMI